jgi:hypothetical protein
MNTLTNKEIFEAMRVSEIEASQRSSLTRTVLVAMLHRLLLGHDHVEDLHWTISPPRNCQAHP